MTQPTTSASKNPFRTGKDLFTSTTAFATPSSTAFYLQFIASLLLSSRTAEPTRTHSMLRHLQDKGKLMRVWTQNIDGLEAKAGLRCCRDHISEEKYHSVTPLSTADQPGSSKKVPQSTVVPLHGNVHYSRCSLCSETYSTPYDSVQTWLNGQSTPCPACLDRSSHRLARSARPIKSGVLLPDLVLYDQPHPGGDDIATIQGRDLAKRPECLVVMGTSLKVVGVKRLVKDFIKSIHAERARKSEWIEARATLPPSRSTTSARESAALPTIVFVNSTPPEKEWESLFDVWIQGDCDDFTHGLETVWKRVRPGDWQHQSKLPVGCVAKQHSAGDKQVVTSKTPRKPLEVRAGIENTCSSHSMLPTPPRTPRRRSPNVKTGIIAPLTPPETPSSSRTSRTVGLKRKREIPQPMLPPTPETTPPHRRVATTYSLTPPPPLRVVPHDDDDHDSHSLADAESVCSSHRSACQDEDESPFDLLDTPSRKRRSVRNVNKVLSSLSFPARRLSRVEVVMGSDTESDLTEIDV